MRSAPGSFAPMQPDHLRRSLTGAVPKALENALENAAADEKPVRPAMSAIGTRVSTTRRRAAANRAAQETRIRAGLKPSPELAQNGI